VRESEFNHAVVAPKSGDLLTQLGRVVVALTRRVSALEAELSAGRARVDGLARRLHDKALHDAARTKGAAQAKALQLRAQNGAAMAGRPDPALLLASLPPAVRDIVQEEAAAHDISPLSIMSLDAHSQVARARRCAMARAVALPMSLSAVGRLFDRNHKTVSWARDTYAAKRAIVQMGPAA
jgi:chromosomal replication initiation ATPase DnaA